LAAPTCSAARRIDAASSCALVECERVQQVALVDRAHVNQAAVQVVMIDDDACPARLLG
jgi:hypothetical protein